MTVKIDPITLAVVRGAITSLCAEMGEALERTSYSPIFTEGLDYSCAMFDGGGEMVAQHAFDPNHLACMPFAVEWSIEEIGAKNLEPGDILFHNDPYRGGNHINDCTIIHPVFYKGQIVAYPAVRAHMIDLGGSAPGNVVGDATEIFQEGLRIPPVKIYRAGKENEEVWKLLLANVRDPKSIRGDIEAIFGSLRVAERRVNQYVKKYGVKTWTDCLNEIKAASERYMRKAIRGIPAGTYEASDQVDDSGPASDPLRIKVALTVKGDSLIADFEGSDPQAPSPMNATYSVSAGHTMVAILQGTGTTGAIEVNQGCLRPIKVLVPPGSVVNVDYPGACVGGNTETSIRVVDAITQALSKAVPHEWVKAGCAGTGYTQTGGGVHPDTGQPWVFYLYWGGGNGARSTGDGNNAQLYFAQNNKSQSVEVLEATYPIIFDEFALARDSPGPGRLRGGVGCRYVWHLSAPEATLSSIGDRTVYPPYGLFGGLPPRARACGHYSDTRIKLKGSDAYKHTTELYGSASPSKWSKVKMRDGDSLETYYAGGAGYGGPLERDPQAVARDIVEEYVSVEGAARDYGVVIIGEGEESRVDVKATNALRKSLRSKKN
jgi:N-methylhydantoinase B/oxoprolinase/acetone carboxylase alpha subunit